MCGNKPQCGRGCVPVSERVCPSAVGCALLHILEFTFSCQPYPYGTSPCTFRLMMSLAPSDLVRGVSSVRACVQVWESVSQCVGMCLNGGWDVRVCICVCVLAICAHGGVRNVHKCTCA